VVGDTCLPDLLNFPLCVLTRLVHGRAALVPNAEKPRHFLHLASETCTLKGGQSFHTRIPTVFEEWAMPMISHILLLPEAFPSAPLVFFFFSFVLETQLILILVFSQKMRGNRSLIPVVPDLLFGDIVPFFFLGPIAGIGLLLPCMLT
jgi:hypothetical protein